MIDPMLLGRLAGAVTRTARELTDAVDMVDQLDGVLGELLYSTGPHRERIYWRARDIHTRAINWRCSQNRLEGERTRAGIMAEYRSATTVR